MSFLSHLTVIESGTRIAIARANIAAAYGKCANFFLSSYCCLLIAIWPVRMPALRSAAAALFAFKYLNFYDKMCVRVLVRVFVCEIKFTFAERE